ncbi:hypothetical protein [Bacillus thuringiensis]|uniref:hypothetical protein n=1 Tax=Bacillus thuringiensis TaxID=1428 RepID=UPI0029CABF3B|nr:hypothetical protein [Bacillus thuringiensis]
MKYLVVVPENLHINYSKSGGAAYNLNHYTWANVTEDGNYKGSGSFPFSIMGK